MGAIYTTILHDVKNKLGISNNEYILLDTIQKLSSRDGVCKAGTDYFTEFVGVSRRTTQRYLVNLIQLGLLQQTKAGFKVTALWTNSTVLNDKMSPETANDDKMSRANDKMSPIRDKMSPVTDAIIIDNNKDNKAQDSELGADLIELNKTLGRTGRLLITKTRLSHFRARLKNFTVADLMKAATAIAANDFMVTGGHNTIDYLLRSDEKIEQWLSKAPQKRMVNIDGVMMESPF